MKGIKKMLLVLLLLMISSSVYSADFMISASLDWALGIRGGVEYRFNRIMGVKADIGLAMFQAPAADAFWVLYFLPQDQRWRLNLLLGIPNAMFPFEVNPFRLYAMVSFGGCLSCGYWFSDSISIDLRLGGSFPLFFGEEDKSMIRPLNFPFFRDTPLRYIWPDLVLTVNFRL
jgi:hypothetical protein